MNDSDRRKVFKKEGFISMPQDVEARTTISSVEADDVAEKLRRDIFSGMRLPRERLIESKLAETYSVSRMIIRQVLSLLEKEDLVVIEPYKGASVAEVSLSNIAENYQIIAMLEAYAAKLATERFTPADIDHLKSIVKVQQELGVDKVKEWKILNTQFHRTINLKCHNEKLVRLIRQNVRYTTYWFLVLSTLGRIPESNKEHILIIDALAKGDPELAAKAVERHILDSGEYLINAIHENVPITVFRRGP
jgi:DNA-binding GntR family transcriptional regulator